MTTLHLRRRILRWGNSYGIRLTRAEVERLRAADRTPVTVDVSTGSERLDVDRLAIFRLGPTASEEHSEDFDEAVDAGY